MGSEDDSVEDQRWLRRVSKVIPSRVEGDFHGGSKVIQSRMEGDSVKNQR